MPASSSKRPLSAMSIVFTVTAAALFGMLLGGGFGAAAATISPGLFRHAFPPIELEPLGTAIVVGAFGGVMCGGALGALAIVAHIVAIVFADRGNDK